MRLLFLLLWRNNFTLFFILFQSFCIYLIINNNYYQHATILNATNSVVTEVMEGYSYVKEYIHLRENNENLAKENASLREMLNDAKYDVDSSRIVVNDSINFQQYKYITAKVNVQSIARINYKVRIR